MKTMQEVKDRSAVGRYVDESPQGTEFRRLAKRILNLCQPKGPLSLMVTSSMRGEGKTTIASNLAISLARKKQQKVVLVDADIRRPQVHVLFGFNRQEGLTELLTGDLEVGAVCRSTQLDNLTVITSGRQHKSPSDLFENNTFGKIMDRLRRDFDIIIFDFPPTIPVSEPEMVGKAMDGVLFVFLAGKTPREVGQRGISILKGADANILGVVVNDLGEVLPYHYRYKYYRYYGAKPELAAGHKVGIDAG